MPILPARRRLVWIVVVGGLAVLASYVIGFITSPGLGAALWRGIPPWLRGLYEASMLLAAAGFFPFTSFILLGSALSRGDGRGWASLGVLDSLYVLILLPSALWMPLTISMIKNPGSAIWIAIRLVLAIVGMASIVLLLWLLAAGRAERSRGYWPAVIGCLAFCIQTAILDAIVWPAYFFR